MLSGDDKRGGPPGRLFCVRVEMMGFEPTTYHLTGGCSTGLSYIPRDDKLHLVSIVKITDIEVH